MWLIVKGAKVLAFEFSSQACHQQQLVCVQLRKLLQGVQNSSNWPSQRSEPIGNLSFG